MYNNSNLNTNKRVDGEGKKKDHASFKCYQTKIMY